MKFPPAIIVAGPTASGKGSLARQICTTLGVPLISLDSMKVYRGMDIGTAKPSRETILRLPIHMVDIRDPWEAFSIGDYLREFTRLAPSLPSPLVFAGGTAFYLHALISGIHPGPPPDDALRSELAREAETIGSSGLHARLSKLDATVAAKIHVTDLRRIIRALEVMELTGERMSDVQARKSALLEPDRFRLVGVQRSRDELYARINRRVELMFAAGWIDEVQHLLEAHDPPWGNEASQSIGYTIIREALEQDRDPREDLELIQNRTRKFARSQLTWFRKMPIEMIGPDEYDAWIVEAERWASAMEDGGNAE